MSHAYQENFGNQRGYVSGRGPRPTPRNDFKERALLAARNYSHRNNEFLREIWRKFQHSPDGMTNEEANQVFDIVREMKANPAPIKPIQAAPKPTPPPLPKPAPNGKYFASDMLTILRARGIKVH